MGIKMSDGNRIGDDLIRGAKPLADFLGWSERQVYNAHARGVLPTFNLGRALCARRSSLRAHIAALEAGHLKQAS